MQKFLFVVNPVSGRRFIKQDIVPLIQDFMRRTGTEYEIAFIARRGDGIRLSRQAAANGFNMVVAVGGDGTVNEIGQGLIGSYTALAVIPAGSGNGFARNLSIPLNPPDALQLLLNPKIIPIDVGRINNYYFFNVAGIGLDAAISKNFEGMGMRGKTSYFLAGAKTFFTYKPARITIKCNDREINTEPLLLCIANAPQYGSGTIIAPHAHPDDGMLDVCYIENISPWKAAVNLTRLFKGTIDIMAEYHSLQTSSLTIECRELRPIHADGEPHPGATMLEVSVVPGKLRVAVGGEQSIS
jgi:YegS/Rv2252/BmrU family lipid kinase